MQIKTDLWQYDRIESHVWVIDQPIIDPEKKVYYAIDVELDCAAELSVPNIGLTGQHIRVITGRPNFDGTPGEAFYEGGAANDHIWYEGIIVNQRMGVSTTSIDIITMGGVATLSGFNFSLKNCDKQFKYINTNNIYFTNRKITHYLVLDNIFYPLWSGVIEDTVISDEEVVFECAGAFNSVHKEMPRRSAISSEFPDVPESYSGKSIPICIGDIPDAQLILTNKSADYYQITDMSASPYMAGFWGASHEIGEPILGQAQIIVWGKTYSVNELAGKYLMMWAGGGNIDRTKMYLIRGNGSVHVETLGALYGISVDVVDIFLDEPLSDFADITQGFAPPLTGSPYEQIYRPTIKLDGGHPLTFTMLSKVWYCKILDFKAEYHFSNLPVKSLILDSRGVPIINIWNEQNKSYEDISALFIDDDLTDAKIELRPKILLGEDSARYNSYIKPDIYQVIGGFWHPETQIPMIGDPAIYVIGGNIASLTDRDRTTYMTATQAGGLNAFCGMLLRIDVDDNLRNAAKSGKLGVQCDISIDAVGDQDYDFNMAIAASDIFEGTTDTWRIVPNVNQAKYFQIPDRILNMIESDYYLSGNSNSEICHGIYGSGTLDGSRFLSQLRELDTEIIGLIADGSVVKLQLWISVANRVHTEPCNAITLKLKEVSFVTTSSVSIDSDSAIVQVKGEKYDTFETNNVYRALQHILHTYDGIPTDIVDMKNLPTTRSSWHVGRQLRDRKSALDYISEICQQSFIGYWQNRNGKLCFKTWLDDKTIIAFHDNNEVLRNSIVSIARSKMMEQYNEFSVRYGYNNITREYEKEFFITNVDAASFPIVSDPTWKTYCGGVEDSGYASAKIMWDLCHASYLKTKTNRKLVVDCPWFIDGSKIAGVPVGIFSSAFGFLVAVAYWATKQKDIIIYEVILNEYTVTLDILDYVSFKDIHLTDDLYRGGWIVGLSNNPEKNTRKITFIADPA